MEFNSFSFAFFFSCVFCVYWMVPGRLRKWILLAASCLFYAEWDWRFLFLMLWVCAADFGFARMIAASELRVRRQRLLIGSIANNLLILGFFKYFNFFSAGFSRLASACGLDVSGPTLDILLPLGISFYTFRSMSYVIDVHQGRMQAVRSLASYAAFVTFFPCLAAGPVERAVHLVPQIERPRTFSRHMFSKGLFLVMCGICQKVVVADNMAIIVRHSLDIGSQTGNGLHMIIAVYGYAFRILADFGGYSNMARGVAALLGFDVVANFRAPYFAAGARDFWRRWHMSLSSWLRDYLYIPLGGSRCGRNRTIANLMITMLLGGLWHGAAWTFVLWGGIHGILLSLEHLWRKTGAPPVDSDAPVTAGGLLRRLVFFNIVCLTWVFFSSQSIEAAMSVFTHLFAPVCFQFDGAAVTALTWMGICVPLLLIIDLVEHSKGDLSAFLGFSLPVRVLVYLVMIYGILIFGVNSAQSFIYARF